MQYLDEKNQYILKPIGFIQSCFIEKNGTPRQGILNKNSKAILKLNFLDNSEQSLEGLEKYSHIWLISYFHENKNKKVFMKVSPPRLEGLKVGVFATRSPHRPNPIGLSIVKLDKIEKSTLYLSGIDLIDGTPILDIKPYLPEYDNEYNVKIPNWIQESPRIPILNVQFTKEAEEQLSSLISKLKFFNSLEKLKKAIVDVVIADPRSIHLKKKYGKELEYGFCIDCLNIIVKFEENNQANIINVEDWSEK